MISKIVLWLLCGWTITAHADWMDFNVNAAIPDNNPSGFQDTQTLSGFGGGIQSLEIRIAVSAAPSDYAFNGDYYVTLQHATGFAVLLNRVGRTGTSLLGYDDNGFNITFTLGGNDLHLYRNFTPGYDSNGALTGTWGVDGRAVDPDVVLDTSPRSDMLANFSGLDPNGTWTIFVADMNQNGNAIFDSWGLNITIIPEPQSLFLLTLGGLLLLRRRGSG